MNRHPIVVVGVGHPYRRDDGVGPAIIDELRSLHLPGVALAESDGEAAALIDLWEDRRLAVLVDAIRAEPGHPGRVHRLAVPHPPAERARAASSHGIDLGEAVELARVLDRMPDRMVLYAIEAGDVSLGHGLTPAVAAAASRVAEEIAAEVTAAGSPDGPEVTAAGSPDGPEVTAAGSPDGPEVTAVP